MLWPTILSWCSRLHEHKIRIKFLSTIKLEAVPFLGWEKGATNEMVLSQLGGILMLPFHENENEV